MRFPISDTDAGNDYRERGEKRNRITIQRKLTQRVFDLPIRIGLSRGL